MAATTGAIALAIVIALLAILCRKRHLNRIRRRAAPNPFVDLDGEMVAVNQPLIIGDGPGAGGEAYFDPYSDNSRQRTQSRSLSATTVPGSVARASHDSSQAVVGSNQAPSQEPRGGFATERYNQRQPIDPRSPPLHIPPSGITHSRSRQSIHQIQTQFSPESPIHRQSSPSFDAGAIAYLRNNEPTYPSPPSPSQFSPGNAEDHRLTSAFTVASGPNTRYSAPTPPPKIDETWRNSPDPIKASSSYRPPIDRRQSFKTSVGGHVYEPGDTVVVAPVDIPTQGLAQGVPSPGSGISSQFTTWGANLTSRPSPITEVSEVQSHSQEGSNGSWTWISNKSMDSSSSSHVIMRAERVHLTPTAPSLVSPPTPSSASHYGESPPSLKSTSQLPPVPPLPPMPSLPTIHPLSLGKKRSAQGAS